MSCAGDCCVAFPLRLTPDELAAKVLAGSLGDGPQLLAMLIPLTDDEARERRARFGVELTVGEDPGDRGCYYMCRNWDETTRLCSVYDERPWMCREYPYGKPCEHGCGYDGGCLVAPAPVTT